MKKAITTIKLSDRTKGRLAGLGKKGETYEEILVRLLDFYTSALEAEAISGEVKRAAEFAEKDESKGAELVARLSNALIKVAPKEALEDRREEEKRLMKMLSLR